MTKEEILQGFDPNSAGAPGKLFGLPYEAEHSDIVILPVPWEVTVSYQTGTAHGPEAILQASQQVDLSRTEFTEPWKAGVCMLPVSSGVAAHGEENRELAASCIKQLQNGEKVSPLDLEIINAACESLAQRVHDVACEWLQKGKIVGLAGGDHSTPFGLMQALASRCPGFGILQIDAHCDLRKAYEGFSYSHASIMYNALRLEEVERLVQVGIRDYCDEELQRIEQSNGRIKTYFDKTLKKELWNGTPWKNTCEKIVDDLPPLIYISFDIDGLDPKLCPHTGTPVPGGLEFDQISLLFETIVSANKKIIGFDLVEVAPGNDEWDANVGARVLRELCNWTAASHKLISLRR
ncbi:MAG: agmatinase [Candidatus Nephrothrix sp. EaCA]|nr:MAG: agmatinase [Candidatus Nephrothrix sp. EaCA]